uniref:Uncharacterized protein n=1 Tax=Chlamydomonas leiostraca TaxID=1034604 RepID=A0A7S0WQ27_9CHLO|mmetsp:Transcript_22963/g.58700  ORF Transcript_22963/g.58700 Transcript_22963/m.58700 type:complete len:136 (+) Transcript_22963:117-524(+)
MQQGFAAKKAKAKAKRAARKLKKKELTKKSGDADMAEVQSGSEDAEIDNIDYTFHGRKGHAEKVDLKRQLKVRVKELKSKRSKLTKLPGHKSVKKEISGAIKELVQEQVTKLGKGKKGKAAAGTAPAAGAADMQE